MTEEYSIGYNEGYKSGWNAAIDYVPAAPKPPQQPTPVQEPVKLRRGDILRCNESDELCTVWATSTTGKTLVHWGGNDFTDYTAEQIGESFWLEPESSDVEIAAEQSDNYAAFHAGVRFARAHASTTPPAAQREWVGLTDRERDQFFKYVTMTSLVKAIEAKLKEKNT